MDYDLIIVGGGPAGLQAALTASYLKLKTLVIELEKAGGALSNKYPWKHVDEYLGFRDMTGGEIAKKIVEHVKKEGAVIRENEEVRAIEKVSDGIKVTSSKGEYKCKTVVLAIGLGVPRKLGVPGEELEGVIYSMSEPMVFSGKRVLVVGGGDTAVEQACSLAGHNAKVTIAHRRDQFRASEKNINTLKECASVRALYNTEVKEISGKGRVEKVKLINNTTNQETVEAFDSVLMLLGTTSNKEFLDKIGVATDKKGSVVIDAGMKTNIEGVFAAGDVVGRWMRIPEALAEGGYAAMNAFKYIKNPYWG